MKHSDLTPEQQHMVKVNHLPVTMQDLINKTNFQLLKAQKTVLVNLSGKKKLTQAEAETIEGMLNLIDTIQDVAVDVFKYDKHKVFNLTDEETEKPNLSLKEAENIILIEDYFDEDKMRISANHVLDNWDKKGFRNKLKKKYTAIYDYPTWEKIFREEDEKRKTF